MKNTQTVGRVDLRTPEMEYLIWEQIKHGRNGTHLIASFVHIQDAYTFCEAQVKRLKKNNKVYRLGIEQLNSGCLDRLIARYESPVELWRS